MTRSKAGWRVLGTVLLAVLIAALLGAAVSSASSVDTVYSVLVERAPVVGGPPIFQSFITTPAASTVTPTAVVILLASGNGEIQLGGLPPDGTLDVNSNDFLVRSRWLFAGQNFYVITPDAAADFYRLANGLEGWEGSNAHVTDILQLIAWARSTVPGVPVWVVGTGRGTAGAFAAGLYNPASGGPDGLVFASPLASTTDTDSVLAAKLSAITVPVLIINNTLDACSGTLLDSDRAIKKALTSSPTVNIKQMVGDDSFTSLTDQCDALAPDGFFGIEPRTVVTIANWINAH